MKTKKRKKIFFSKFDIVVGIPSLNEADSISFVVSQVDKGLTKHFPKHKALIVNVDNCSPDNTKGAFLRTKTKNRKRYISTPAGIKGKGHNFFNLFNLVESVGAQAILVVDADLKSITPDWVLKMLTPVFRGYDYVLPLYSRNEYDGTITNFICYPLLYGLLANNIRQPIAGDFAFSSHLSHHYLKLKWFPNTYQFGIDIFMTMNAILGGFKIGQVVLGSKIHKPSAPKLGPMFTQVVSTLFKNILVTKKLWLDQKRVTTPPIIYRGESTPPQSLSIDYKTLKKTAIDTFNQKEKWLKKFLTKNNFAKAKSLIQKEQMLLDDKMWMELVFDLLASYHKSKFSPAIIEALKGLYFARTASFIKQTLDEDHTQAEKRLVEQAKLFYKNRNKLISKLD